MTLIEVTAQAEGDETVSDHFAFDYEKVAAAQRSAAAAPQRAAPGLDRGVVLVVHGCGDAGAGHADADFELPMPLYVAGRVDGAAPLAVARAALAWRCGFGPDADRRCGEPWQHS